MTNVPSDRKTKSVPGATAGESLTTHTLLTKLPGASPGAPAVEAVGAEQPASARATVATRTRTRGTAGSMRPKFTDLQGQYLAFIEAYTTLHGIAPAEADMQRFFRVTPPAVHRMVLTLERRGLLERVPGRGRSVRLLLPSSEIPKLERRGKAGAF
jgi:hypothetical protein